MTTVRERPAVVGDVVEIGTQRYRITDFHMTDEGAMARLMWVVGGPVFVMAHELRWTGDCWVRGSEAEDRVLDGNR